MNLFSRKKYFFLFLLVQLLFGCINRKDAFQSNSVIINPDFTTENINLRVLYSTAFQEKDLKSKNLQSTILKQFKPNHKRKSVFLGSYKNHPDGWFYLQLINANKASQSLVVFEDNHIRCDGIEVFSFKSDKLTLLGKVERTMSISERPLPNFEYAIPFVINANDTLNILIHTQRFYGVHSLNLNLSDYHIYLEKIQYKFLTQLFQLIVFALSMLVMYIIGWIFTDQTMLYLAIYITATLFSVISFLGFIDTIPLSQNIGLKAHNLNSFSIFLLNALYHPYGMILLKFVPKNEKLFKTISYFLIAINVVVALMFFLPVNLFLRVDFYIPPIMTILGLISIFWIFYSAILAYFRTNVKYFLIACCIAFLPFCFDQIINVLFDAENILTLKISQSSFLLAVVSVSIISIFQLREKLVSRKNHEENLTNLKETMEDIRKSEIEIIGRNLHDQVGNTLASALGYLNMKNPKFEITQNLIMDSIKEIRFLSHNLVKDEDNPISIKIESLVSRFNDFSTINFQYNDFTNAKLNQLGSLKQQNIYMIIQEILTNIIKHSKAKEAYIQVFENDKIIQINIEDDGIGFDNYQINTTGIGLNNINKRAKLSDLKLTIDSTNQGTSIIIEVKNEDKDNHYR